MNIKPPEEKICAACGSAFLVGGRGRPPRRQRLCSDACQRSARYRHGAKAHGLSATEAAYIAGILDGEGSVMLSRSGSSVRLLVGVTNTNQDVLDWLRTISGVGAINRQYAEGQINPHRKATWFWRINAEAAETLLRQLQPFLIIKAEQAALAVKFQERLRDPAFKADRVWQLEAMARMRALNRRGPRTGGEL